MGAGGITWAHAKLSDWEGKEQISFIGKRMILFYFFRIKNK